MSENVKTEKGVRVQVSISDQNMKASVCLAAPNNDQEPPVTLQEVIDALNKARVKSGIN